MNDRVTLRFLAAPSDGVADGSTVQAGSVLEWIDKAGYACAVGWTASSCVTAYVGNVHFTRAIRPGELVEAEARVIHTGRTSIHVRVAIASADVRDGAFEAATHCILVFVAIDETGRPKEVPSWVPQSVEDLELAEGAEARIVARANIHDEMRAQAYTTEGTTPRIEFRFLASPSVVNFGGNAHGGTVLRWINDAASTVATSWCGRDTVAVYAGGVHFYRPIHIGHIVELQSRLIHTGARSMHVVTHVRSGDPRTGQLELTTRCLTVLVAKEPHGRALEVPSLLLRSDEDAALDAHAVKLIAMRAELNIGMPADAV
jgi:4-hydroxybenzoyl-CoA thioesterase